MVQDEDQRGLEALDDRISRIIAEMGRPDLDLTAREDLQAQLVVLTSLRFEMSKTVDNSS